MFEIEVITLISNLLVVFVLFVVINIYIFVFSKRPSGLYALFRASLGSESALLILQLTKLYHRKMRCYQLNTYFSRLSTRCREMLRPKSKETPPVMIVGMIAME
jgi:hypothetical protein